MADSVPPKIVPPAIVPVADAAPRRAPDANWLAVWAGAVAALGMVVLGPRLERLATYDATLAPLIPAAAALIVAVVARIWHPRRAADLQIISVSAVLVVILVGTPLLILDVAHTAPGRAARSAAQKWTMVGGQRFGGPSGCTDLPEDSHGTGQRCLRDGAMRIQLMMKGLDSASQESTGLTVPMAGTWYSEVRVRQADGPAGTVCAMLFGHLAEDQFYALRMQAGTLEVTLLSGAGAARSIFQATLPRNAKADRWTRLGIRLDGDEATFFVNDRRVGETTIKPPPDGPVDLATILPRGNRPYQATCTFDDLFVARA
jgi:hypothetical protein